MDSPIFIIYVLFTHVRQMRKIIHFRNTETRTLTQRKLQIWLTNITNQFLSFCYRQIVIYTWFGLLMDYPMFTVECFMHNMHADPSYPMYTYCDTKTFPETNKCYLSFFFISYGHCYWESKKSYLCLFSFQ